MPAEHPYDYWKAVALAIEAENAKAKIYVAHDASLGTAREAILRRVLVNETPGPYKVKTGLIWAARPEGNREPCVSKQCDLLVYDSHADTPLYRIDDFVVMHYNAAKFIVEVKSCLEEKTFREVIGIFQSLRPFSELIHRMFNVVVAGFAFEGVAFETFLGYLAKNINGHAYNLPHCLAVHSQNYVAFRYRTMPEHYPHAARYYALDFTQLGDKPGLATAFFLRLYAGWLLEDQLNQFDLKIANLVEEAGLPVTGMKWISPDGKINEGPFYPDISSTPEGKISK